MKLHVLCVHWTLLFISITSSCALFLLVASENIQTSIKTSYSVKENANEVIDNLTIDVKNEHHFKLSSADDVPEIQKRTTTETDINDNLIEQNKQNAVQQHKSNKLNKESGSTNDLEDTITIGHISNTSEGISETGQAVVLTLVDSAAAELQSLAEPKISDSQPDVQPAARNGSTLSPSSPTTASFPTLKSEDAEAGVTQTEQPTYQPVEGHTDALTMENNSYGSADASDPANRKKLEEEEEVAEAPKLRPDEEAYSKDDEVAPREAPKVDEAMTTAPELNDSAARAQLIADESSGVIFDSLVTAGPTEPHEDIPSFSEWTQKRLEEAEKKKNHPNVSVQNPGGPGRGVGSMRIRLKNYASPDCGAKVVAANPEARSARSVLVANKDEYMLNTCTSRIWFVVELCEAIQSKKIELANFELFSSSPKNFSVYVSDRFPTRDWSSVGQFTARDEKGIQGFNLHPHLFGKFIKVELQSVYGSEHFCPISLFRAYGTSEFEVLETETENHVQESSQVNHEDEDEDGNNDEELFDPEGGSSRNLFGSATDAVINIVKKATQVLVKSGNSENNDTLKRENHETNSTSDFGQTCGSLKYSVVCKNCTNHTFFNVVRLLTCSSKSLENLADVPAIEKILRNTNLCLQSNNSCVNRLNFLSTFFADYDVVSLCNVMAIRDRKVTLNPSHEVNAINSSDVQKEEAFVSPMGNEETEAPSLMTQGTSTSRHSEVHPVPRVTNLDVNPEHTNTESKNHAPMMPDTVSVENIAMQIKPTKTMHKEEVNKDVTELPVIEEKLREVGEDVNNQQEIISTSPVIGTFSGPSSSFRIHEESSPMATPVETMTTSTITVENVEVPADSQEVLPETTKGKYIEVKGETDQNKLFIAEQDMKIPSQDQNTFDSILSDLKELEGDSIGMGNGQAHKESLASHPATNTNTPQQKESVFLRLSNRIKALERNMSLSSQYLEELSRRYKKQVEEMQRSLERAVIAMSEESRKTEERDARRLEEIESLRVEIAILSKSIKNLLADRASWRYMFSTFSQHAIFIFFDVFLIVIILYYCRKNDDLDNLNYDDDSSSGSAVNNQVPQNKQVSFIPGKRVATKKQKKRRPSEVASNISGTYQDLMIEDRTANENKDRKEKDKKKKRKKNEDAKTEIVKYKNVSSIPGGSMLPSRRASSNDTPEGVKDQHNVRQRPESAPSTTISRLEDVPRVQVLTNMNLRRRSQESNESDSSTKYGDAPSNDAEFPKGNAKNSGILKNSRFSSPSFMRTALKSRSKRMSFKVDKAEDKSVVATGLKQVEDLNGNTNGHADESDESRSGCVTPTPMRKEKKGAGLKKMVRKFF